MACSQSADYLCEGGRAPRGAACVGPSYICPHLAVTTAYMYAHQPPCAHVRQAPSDTDPRLGQVAVCKMHVGGWPTLSGSYSYSGCGLRNTYRVLACIS